jgi:hypothetical protein
MPSLVELVKALRQLEQQGYIPASRGGPTAIGHTLELALGLKESNIQIPDLGGRVEIKSARRTSTSLITLFTFNRGAWLMRQREVIETYGYYDQQHRRKALYSTVWANAPNKQGFILQVDRANQSIILQHASEPIACWSAYRLTGALLYKLGKVLYVIADSRVSRREFEEFHYNEAYLLEDPSPENFLAAFEESKVCIDLRLHLKKGGAVRNHGTGFRIRQNALDSLFSRVRKLV